MLIHREARTNDELSLIYKWLVEKKVRIEDKDDKVHSFFLEKIKNIGEDAPEYESAFFSNLLYS